MASIAIHANKTQIPVHRDSRSLAFVLAVGVIAGVSLLSYFSLQRLVDAGQGVAHTRQVMFGFAQLTALIEEAESTRLSYVVTGQNTFQDSYDTTVAAVPDAIIDVRRLTADNPDQQRRLDILAPLIMSRLKMLDGLRFRNGPARPSDLTSLVAGDALMTRIEAISAEMQGVENDLLPRRIDAAALQARWLWRLFFFGTIVSTGLMVYVYSVVAREVLRRRRAEAKLLTVNGELEARVAARTAELEKEIVNHHDTEKTLRQLQKMEAVGQLTGGIAHDFNNLLGVIMGNLDLVYERTDPNSNARTRVQAALDGATHGAELTKRLLAFSRQQRLQPKAINLGASLPQTAAMLRRTLGEHITVELRPRVGLWPCLADPSQVEDAILNLAINGRDAMPKGGTLTIEAANVHLDAQYAATEAEVSAGDYVLLSVTDTGCGMSPEVLERAYEPFYTTKEPGAGTGLGLSMVYGFVKQSKGHIKIYSEVGHGTSVKLYLPRAAAVSAIPAPVDAGAIPKGHETILVVEDNSALRAATVNQLTTFGYRVLEAESAPAALDMIARHPEISLLFSDVVMPGGMTGLELAREARRRWPELKVMLTSGYTSLPMADRSADMAGLEILVKPIRMRDLALKVRQVLGQAA
jgi:signal transduction histidine kinase